MEINGDSNAAFWKAYPKSNVDLWDQNVVNGEFVIAYELSPGLDHKLQNMLPEVNSRFVHRTRIKLVCKSNPKF